MGNLIELVSAALDAQGFGTIYGEQDLKTLTQTQKNLNRKNGVPEDSNLPKLRDHQPGHPILQAIDRVLSNGLMDGQPSSHRMPIVNLIKAVTYPDELPALRDKILHRLENDDGVLKHDAWIASIVLISKGDIYSEHSAWGKQISERILASSKASPRSREFVAEFIRSSVGAETGSGTYGKYLSQRLDKKSREIALEQRPKLSPNQARYVAWARQAAWRLLKDDHPQVRRAAAFAIAGNALLYSSLDKQIVQGLKTFTGNARASLLELVAMSEPGFLPEVDAYLGSTEFRAKPPDEVRKLEIRFDPATTHMVQAPICKDIFSVKFRK